MSDRFVFSTEAWPERDRFAAWCEGVVRRYARLDLTTTQDQSRFRATIEARRIGAVDIAHWFMTPVSVVRTPSLCATATTRSMSRSSTAAPATKRSVRTIKK